MMEFAGDMANLGHYSLRDPHNFSRVRIILEELEKDGFCTPKRQEHWENYFVYFPEFLSRCNKKRAINASKELVAVLEKKNRNALRP